MRASTSSRPSWLLVTALGGLLIGLLAGPVLGSTTPPPGTRQAAPALDGEAPEHVISVSGSGTVTVTPDMATIQLGVVVEKPTAKGAHAAAAEAMTKVVAAIRAQGIRDEDIATALVSLSPVYDYNKVPQKIRGYQVQNTVSVTVRDVAKIAGVLDDGVAAGATSVNGIGFDVADRTAAEAKAREAAMADAKARATSLAAAAGVSITGVAAISESIVTPPWYGRDGLFAAGAEEAATPVLPGSTDVTITVNVSYLID